jgi:hypothetical protein
VGVLLDTGTNKSWFLAEVAQASRRFVPHVVRPTDYKGYYAYPPDANAAATPGSPEVKRN